MGIQVALQNSSKSAADYQDTIKRVQKEYEDEVEKMKQEYSTLSAAKRAAYQKSITDKFNAYKASFNSERDTYLTALDGTVTSVQNKVYGLRMASMTQRSMLSVMFLNFCDFLYYHAFEECNQDEVPLLGDDMQTLLTKLNNIQWDTVVNRYLPANPIPFNMEITIDDNVTVPSWNSFHTPITNLVNSTNAAINLKDYIPSDQFYKQWRWRINELEVLLLDHNNKVIPSKGVDIGQGISLGIHYPPVFNDIDSRGSSHTFLAQAFYCRSTYQTHEDGQNVFSEKCKVDSEFSYYNYKAAPDGIFKFHLISGQDALDYHQVEKIKVKMAGSWIPFPEVGEEYYEDIFSNEDYY